MSEAEEAVIAVVLERSPDGGLRAYSDEVPGFVLSHADPLQLLGDIQLVLEVFLKHARGHEFSVKWFSEYRGVSLSSPSSIRFAKPANIPAMGKESGENR